MQYHAMPFGKYKGVVVNELPDTYLVYAIRTFELPQELRNLLCFELLDRVGFDYSFNIVECEKRYSSIRKKLAIKYHPDKGGSNEAMQAVNEFYEELIKK
jgi:uncharacterized protein (DUF3820 family)